MTSFAIDTIEKTVFGNKRITFGRVTLINGDVDGEIDTSLSECEVFLMPGAEAWTQSAGLVSIATLLDPGAGGAGTIDWIAMGH